MTPKKFLFGALLIAILVVPNNLSPSITDWLQDVGSRIETPVTADEKTELEFLDCLEKFSLAIPDGADVQLSSDGNSYFVQRAQDILYPRVRLVQDEAEFIFSMGIAPTTSQVERNYINCSGLEMWVITND